MASDTKKAGYDVNSQVKDAVERDDWAKVARILSECSRRDSDSIMTQLVSRDQWDAVKQVVIRCVGDEERTWDIEGVLAKNNILLSVAEGNWRRIGEMPHERFLHSTLEWILEQACTRAQQTDIVQYVLPHCEYDQLDSALQQLVTHGLWFAAGRMLQRPVCGERVRWVIQQACQRAEKLTLRAHMIHFCPKSSLDFFLTELVSRDMWQAAGCVLMRGVSDTKHCWALKEACCRAEGWQVKRFILPFCTQGHCNYVLTNLALESQWKSVKNLLNCVKNVSWAMTKEDCNSVDLADKGKVNQTNSEASSGTTDVSSSYSTDLEEEDCSSVDSADTWAECKGEVDQTKSVTQILQQALLFDNDQVIVEHVLPHCTDSQTDLAVTELVSAGQWKSVTKLVTFVGDRKQTWTVGGTSVDTTLLHLVAGGRWREVGDMLQQGVDDAQFRWAADTAMLHADDSIFAEHICCLVVDSGYQGIDSVLAKMVYRSKWKSVQKLLQLNEKKMWTVNELEVDRETLRLVAEGRWREVGITFKQGVSDSQRWWLKETASLAATSMDYRQYILPHCSDDQLDSVLTTLVRRCLWGAVGVVLQRGVSDAVKHWAIIQACSYSAGSFRQDILPHFADDQLDSVLTTLIEQRLWWNVGAVLKRGASDSVKQWAILEGCRQNVRCFLEYILPHCADDQLDDVLKSLVEQRRWHAVMKMLKRGVSDAVKQWVVEEPCVASNQIWYALNILPHCADDQVDTVLAILVERRLFLAVAYILDRYVSDSVKQWAVMEACKHFDDPDSVSLLNILPHCADDQLDSVLTTLAERHLWRAVGNILERVKKVSGGQVSDVQRVSGDLNTDLAGQETCKHCKSAGVYFSEYYVHAPDSHATNTCTQHCADGNLHSPTSSLTKRDECTAVRKVSGRQVSDAQRRENIKTAFRCADEDTLIQSILPYYVYDSVHSSLKMLASRGFWSAFLVLLHDCIIDILYVWAVAIDTESTDEVFWDMVRNPCDGVKDLTPAMWRSVTWSGLQRSLKQLLDWDTPLCEVLCESLLSIVRELWLSGCKSKTDDQEHTVMNEAVSTVEHLHQQIAAVPVIDCNCKSYHVSRLLSRTEGLSHEYSERKSANCFVFQLYFIKNLVHQNYKRKAWTQMTDAILLVLTTVPVVPDVQSVALRVMLRHKRWDIIRHACLSGLCEQDRRQLFQAAVKQRQWSAVKRWADHTLYDDQRLWALGEARQEKRWDVYLKLADHGLSEWERVGVLFRVTMHADWKLVRHMLKTVADVTDMIDLLTNTPGTLAKLGATQYEQRLNKLKAFEEDLKKDTNTLRTLKTMAKRGKWWVVLHNIRHKPDLQHARRALKAAVSSEAWHAVIQLVRLEIDVTRRDSLFRDMVRLRQWAVCRELLEQGVSHELSLEFLSEFIEHSQWTFVAMVMNCPMDDEPRKKIIHQSMMMKEGSVVWECINRLQTRLSVEERDNLFKLSFNREVWQAVKPLIEEKDVTGIRHRDTALLEAIEQHQWDVVDHCQRHHADINMKDDCGHTPIHRAARKGDWEAVKELTVRDGDPNLLDSEGLSVLHRAIKAEQWHAVTLLIQFHGDIHKPDEYRYRYSRDWWDTRTPLQMLINARQGEVIESTLMWCPDQWKGLNFKEETVLHAMCLSGRPGALYHLIARKVDPLAVTETGHTALCYAVLCKDCPQRMVAECIQMGLSAHQPQITDTAQSDRTKHGCYRYNYIYTLTYEQTRLLVSPLVLAVMRGLPVVTQMLCEAGACSNRQLFQMNTHPVDLLEQTSRKNNMKAAFEKVWQYVHCESVPKYSFNSDSMQQSADYLRKMCSTPRSLVSTCRLVISRCLTLSKTRHRDIAQLPLSPMMKNYLMFSDLTDPRYPDLSSKS